jgi:hypothetical protein
MSSLRRWASLSRSEDVECPSPAGDFNHNRERLEQEVDASDVAAIASLHRLGLRSRQARLAHQREESPLEHRVATTVDQELVQCSCAPSPRAAELAESSLEDHRRPGAGGANWARIVSLVDLGGNRLGCCDNSRPDHRLGQIPPRSGRRSRRQPGRPPFGALAGVMVEQATTPSIGGRADASENPGQIAIGAVIASSSRSRSAGETPTSRPRRPPLT